MIVICASGKELELSGSVAELQEISRALLALTHGHVCRFDADIDADPGPYPRVLSAMETYISDGPMRVSAEDDVLYLTGSPERIENFASWFEFDEDAVSGAHSHHEWVPGIDYISSDSRALVVSVA